MRLTPTQIATIKDATAETTDNPTMLAARLSARVSRSMHGRHVDVVVLAPGFSAQPIHRQARAQGIRL